MSTYTATLEINHTAHMNKVYDLVHITDAEGNEVDTLWITPAEDKAPYIAAAAAEGWNWDGEDGPITRK